MTNRVKAKSLNNDLQFILGEADKITLTDLEFDNLFKEQSKILCDIKTLLNKDRDANSSNTTKPSINNNIEVGQCKLINLNDSNTFNNLLQNYKKKYNLSKSNISSVARIKTRKHSGKHNISKHHSKIKKTIKPKNTTITKKTKKTFLKSQKSQKSMKSMKHLKSMGNMEKMNNNYPIILLKDKKPYKNVLMMK